MLYNFDWFMLQKLLNDLFFLLSMSETCMNLNKVGVDVNLNNGQI